MPEIKCIDIQNSSTSLWAEYGIGDMCGEQYTASLSIAEWVCPTVRLSGMKNPLPDTVN
ncbi:MAG: hypothetical protein GY749_28875 [Desulfobacteraceae bacterium]|nr:hypothetical protein [Desulfobacteraceae bacterium]